MNRKFKIGNKVRILWGRTGYFITQAYMDTGEVKSYLITDNGEPLVELYNFHRTDKRYSLYFPVDTIRPLKDEVKDGDTL